MNKYNPDQLKAVTHINGPALVLAGPGSGKTSVITGRIQYLITNHNVNPDKILVITFTKEAASEMKARFYAGLSNPCNNTGVHFGTFHSLFYHILKKQRLYKENSVLTVQDKVKIIIGIGTGLGIKEAVFEEWQKEILSKISILKTGRNPFDEDEDDNSRLEFQRIFDEYTTICKRMNCLDFDDMIIECRRLFENIPKVLIKWQLKYEYIMVDEFQDIDNIQYELLKMLSGDNDNVFCVGDDDQSIYSFRGADSEIMKKYEQEYAEKGLRIITLKTNYRSADNVIKASAKLISQNKFRFEKEQTGLLRAASGVTEAVVFKDQLAQANYVCKSILELLSGDKNLSIAILYRSERNSEVLRGCLEKMQLAGDRKKRLVNELREDILSYFSIIYSEPKLNDFLRIINRPVRGLLRESLGNFFQNTERIEREEARRVLEEIVRFHNSDDASVNLRSDLLFMEDMPMFAAYNYLMSKVGYKEYITDKYKEESDRKLLHAEMDAIGQRIRNSASFRELQKELRRIISLDENSDNDKHEIVLQTVHASKGLEYDAVFIIGLQEGIFPGKKSVTAQQLEEERRIMYVAMTRAKSFLYLCGIKKDDYGKQESRFIHECGIKISYEKNKESLPSC